MTQWAGVSVESLSSVYHKCKPERRLSRSVPVTERADQVTLATVLLTPSYIIMSKQNEEKKKIEKMMVNVERESEDIDYVNK